MSTPSQSQSALQLQHLWSSSHALAVSSPAVSAHLMARYLALSNAVSDDHRITRTVCPACCSIRIPGWNTTVRTGSLRTRPKNKRKPRGGDGVGKHITYHCSVCRKSVREEFAPKKAARKEELETREGKKTAKDRKKKRVAANSLSAALAAQKQRSAGGGASRSGGFGLDLMDLMKTG